MSDAKNPKNISTELQYTANGLQNHAQYFVKKIKPEMLHLIYAIIIK